MEKIKTKFNDDVIYNIGGYKVRISKRKYPTFTANFCYLDLEEKEEDITLGDPVLDLRKTKTKNEIKNRVKRYFIREKIGYEKMEEIYNKFSFGEVFDYINDDLKVNEDFFNKFKMKYLN